MTIKNRVLELLEKNAGKSISGQAIADQLGVSRNTVWKAINSLKADGYRIESCTNRGYMFSSSNDILSVAALEAAFEVSHPDLRLEVFEMIDSTQDEAKRMLSDGFEGTAAIAAGCQSGGRGRRGREFYSPEGGAYVTVLMQNRAEASDAVFVTMAAAVATVRAIRKTCVCHGGGCGTNESASENASENVAESVVENAGESVAENVTQNSEAARIGLGGNPGIKWVNDIYMNGKKVCGILSEGITDLETGTISSIAVGIGLNVGKQSFPDSIADKAGYVELREGLGRNELLGAVIENLLELSMLGENRPVGQPTRETILREYRKFSFVPGMDIEYEKQGEKISAKALRIDDGGGLVVTRCDTGTVETLRAGEISVRF